VRANISKDRKRQRIGAGGLLEARERRQEEGVSDRKRGADATGVKLFVDSKCSPRAARARSHAARGEDGGWCNTHVTVVDALLSLDACDRRRRGCGRVDGGLRKLSDSCHRVSRTEPHKKRGDKWDKCVREKTDAPELRRGKRAAHDEGRGTKMATTACGVMTQSDTE
jgi:hypothetical protein